MIKLKREIKTYRKIMKSIIRDVDIEESVYVLYNTLNILYAHYRFTLPKPLEKQFHKLCDSFEEEYTKDYIKDLDITDVVLNEKIEYNATHQTHNETISYYELLTLVKDNKQLPNKIRVRIGNYYANYKIVRDEVDNSFRYYTIEDESLVNDSKGINSFLNDNFLESGCLDKCIDILD